ncbi:mitochondrial chaperone [Rhizoclosmatium hyalinum]|nr:mitochondrial chaperone [Rhizoclosmatium hyalinum]
MNAISGITAITLSNWKRVKTGIRSSLDPKQNGSLLPVANLLSGNQMQSALTSLLPLFIGNFNTGVMVVDMFIISSATTILMAIISCMGSVVTQIIAEEEQSEQDDFDINLQVKVDYHCLDRYNEAQENVHWKALAWMITQRTKGQTKGKFRMVPFVAENDEDCSNNDDSDDESAPKTLAPVFNILPVGDRELIIEYNGAHCIVQFQNVTPPTQDEESEDGKKIVRAPVDPLIHKEPPIVIRRIHEETATLEWFQMFLTEITNLYLASKASKKRRARYERPANRSYWRWVQALKSTRSLSSVALDKTQETLLLRDLDTFVNDRGFYQRMGLPYRRGYLFSGKPGTGKTSLISAISATYNYDLYYMNLGDIKSDTDLASAFASVPKHSIIVLEDIDAQSAEVHTRERRYALKKVDKMRQWKEKEKEAKKKKKEKLQAKLLEEVEKETSESEVEETKKENSPAKKAGKVSVEELWKDEEEDMFADLGMGLGGFGMDGFGMGGGNGWFGSSGMGGGMGGLSGMGGFGGMGFGDLKLTGGSLFSGFTLSQLLNCLDGHMLADDLIICMTSNHPEVLDPALIRPGRIDLHLSLGYCTRYQLNRMFQSVMNDPSVSLDFDKFPVAEGVIAPCDAQRLMILYRSNPEVIAERLMERANELLDGKPLSTGIQGGESGLVSKCPEDTSLDSGASSFGSENGESTLSSVTF